MSNVLLVGAHCDDECLLAGGSLAKHVADGDEVSVLIMSPGVGSRDWSREGIPARVAMCDKASDIIGYDATILDWPDQRFDTRSQLELNKAIEFHLGVHNFKPDIVYTHWDQDNNLDHRLVSQACMVACRSVGKIYMGMPNGGWSHRYFEYFGESYNVREFLEVKQRALDCYKDELGDVIANPVEQFIVTEWVP